MRKLKLWILWGTMFTLSIIGFLIIIIPLGIGWVFVTLLEKLDKQAKLECERLNN